MENSTSSSVVINPFSYMLPELQSARRKLSHALEYFHTKHEGSGLEVRQLQSLPGFESKSLEPHEFREQVYRAFHVRLDKPEINGLVSLLDTDENGTINTKMFIKEMIRLSNNVKAMNKNLRAKERNNNIVKKQQKLERKINERLMKNDRRVAATWTEEEEREAVRKLSVAASRYDRFHMNGHLRSMQGFTSNGYLDATQLSEQCRRQLDLTLSARDVAALMGIFDPQESGFIDTQEFLQYFYRLSRKERDRQHRLNAEVAARVRSLKADTERAIAVKFNRALSPPRRLAAPTDEQHESFLSKLRHAAISFDVQRFPGLSESNFDVVSLNHEELRNSLQKHFGVHLTDGEYVYCSQCTVYMLISMVFVGELSAAVQLFDLDKDGRISCAEFTVVFNKLRSRELASIHEHNRKIRVRRAQEDEQFMRTKQKKAIKALRLQVEKISLPGSDDGGYSDENDERAIGLRSANGARVYVHVSESTKVFLHSCPFVYSVFSTVHVCIYRSFFRASSRRRSVFVVSRPRLVSELACDHCLVYPVQAVMIK